MLILTLALMPHRRYVCRLDFHHVTVCLGHAQASARMRASLPRCVITRAMRGADSREEGSIWNSTRSKTQRANTARVLPMALSYVASSLAGPRPGIRMTPRVYVASRSEQRYLARCVGPRDLGLLKPCS